MGINSITISLKLRNFCEIWEKWEKIIQYNLFRNFFPYDSGNNGKNDHKIALKYGEFWEKDDKYVFKSLAEVLI
jgi:hypothetical protein